MINLLLKNNVDVNFTDDNGCTALHFGKCFLKILFYVLIFEILYQASEKGNTKIVEMLLTHMANVNLKAENGGTALHAATFYGHIGIIELLLKYHADINVKTNDGLTAYDIVSQTKHKEVTKLIMSYKQS